MDQQRKAPYPNNIRALRMAANLSQEALAQETGYQVERIIRLEEHGKRPLKRVLEKIALALNCSPDDLLPRDSGSNHPRSEQHETQASVTYHRTRALGQHYLLEKHRPDDLAQVRKLNQPPTPCSGHQPRFPNKLRLLRELSGLSQASLADGADVKATKISKWEKGSVMLLPSDAKALARTLGCAPGDFYYCTPQPIKETDIV